MDFGKVPEALLQTINFSLPEEPITNKLVLSAIKTSEPKVYIGCAKWGRKEWVDNLFIKKTKEKDFLKEYVKHYNSVGVKCHLS